MRQLVSIGDIADNFSKAGWSVGWVSALDLEGRTIWIADAHRDDGKRFIVRADEKLSVFVELEREVRGRAGNPHPEENDAPHGLNSVMFYETHPCAVKKNLQGLITILRLVWRIGAP